VDSCELDDGDDLILAELLGAGPVPNIHPLGRVIDADPRALGSNDRLWR
jgi:hypothetical protein